MQRGTDRRKTIKKPNRFLYRFTIWLGTLLMGLWFGTRVDRKAIRGIKPPFIVVANHGFGYDFLVSCIAMRKYRLHVVTAQIHFERPFKGWLLKQLGCIPKVQLIPDIESIRNMLSVVRKEKGSLLLFPAGQLTYNGKEGILPPGIGKLLKHLNVPVIRVLSTGGHLTKPKWTDRARRGRVFVKVEPLLTQEQLRSMSSDALDAFIEESLRFNDYETLARQRKVKFRISKRNRGRGIANVLYQCPRCRAHGMYVHHNELICRECGNTAVIDIYGMLNPKTDQDVVFDTPVAWTDFERRCVLEDLSDPQACITQTVRAELQADGQNMYSHYGHGTLTLDQNGIRFEGTRGNTPVCLYAPMKNIPGLLFTPGQKVELPFAGELYRFYFESNRQDAMRWVLAVEGLIDNLNRRSSE